jgi:hypothetical protein
VTLAGCSPIARYSWGGRRGIAPAGYIKGMAVTFALVCQKWKAGDLAALVMAAPNSGDDKTDALSWYDSTFHALGRSRPNGDGQQNLIAQLRASCPIEFRLIHITCERRPRLSHPEG